MKMEPFGLAHFGYLLFTIIFLLLGVLIVRKSNRFVQNIIFILIVILGSGGIFFRYGLNLSFSNKINIKTLATQMLQVCNFNFILLPTTLIKKNELGRQYLFYFSGFAAATVFFSFSSALYRYDWNSIVVVNFWLNHLATASLPLFMLVSGRFKPRKEYILKVSICIVLYFCFSALGSLYLMRYQNYPRERTFSFVFTPEENFILEFLYSIIPLYFFYLTPLLPILIGIFYLLARVFKNYQVSEF